MVEHSGVDNYRGMEIKWAISEIDGSGLWRATAAIVTPPGAWSPPAVKSVPDIPERFNSEENAHDILSIRPPPLSTLFPYTTQFRSGGIAKTLFPAGGD